MKKEWQIKAEVALVRKFTGFFQKMPHSRALSIAGCIGVIAHDLLGIRRQLAVDQLRASFPERSERWAKTVVRELYRHLATHAAELARFPVLSKETIDRIVTVQGEELIDEALSEGRGVIGLSAHLGAWEYSGAWTAAHGYPCTYVVAQQANPVLEEMIDQHRRHFGVEIIKRMDATRGILRALKNNRILVLMIDQDGGGSGAFVPYFGRLASTFRGPAVLAMKSKAPILLITNHRLGRSKVEMKIQRIPFETDGNREAVVKDLLKRVTGMLEDEVRKYPQEWLWLHKRWKTRPQID